MSRKHAVYLQDTSRKMIGQYRNHIGKYRSGSCRQKGCSCLATSRLRYMAECSRVPTPRFVIGFIMCLEVVKVFDMSLDVLSLQTHRIYGVSFFFIFLLVCLKNTFCLCPFDRLLVCSDLTVYLFVCVSTCLSVSACLVWLASVVRPCVLEIREWLARLHETLLVHQYCQ